MNQKNELGVIVELFVLRNFVCALLKTATNCTEEYLKCYLDQMVGTIWSSLSPLMGAQVEERDIQECAAGLRQTYLHTFRNQT